MQQSERMAETLTFADVRDGSLVFNDDTGGDIAVWNSPTGDVRFGEVVFVTIDRATYVVRDMHSDRPRVLIFAPTGRWPEPYFTPHPAYRWTPLDKRWTIDNVIESVSLTRKVVP